MADRIYIEIEVIFYPDGCLTPVSIVLEGKRIQVNKVSGPILQLSAKSGGTAVKYACQA